MKKGLKTTISLLCATALTLALLILPSSASEDLFFLSINDTIAVQTSQTTPIQHGGWIYVPVSVFNSNVTGVNFGIYYGFTNNNETLVFYNLSGKTMTFNLQTGTAAVLSGEAPVPGKVVRQNGVYYVPAYAICQYFGLKYSFYSTEYGPFLRIKDGNAMLSDALFLNSAASIMRSRVNGYHQNQVPNGGGNQGGGTTIPIPSVPGSPGNSDSVESPADPNVPVPPEIPDNTPPAPTFSLYLGVQASPKRNITPTLNALNSVGAAGVVFFPAGAVEECADQIRQAAGRGHKVGLIPEGDTSAQRLESVQNGSRRLASILRQETWFVLGSDQALSDAGYLCWSPSLTFSEVRDATRTYNSLVKAGAHKNDALRLLVHSQSSSGLLAGVLGQLKEDGDIFLVLRETRY